MRYIDLNAAIASIPGEVLGPLRIIDKAMNLATDEQKVTNADKGNRHWSPIKPYFENISNRKCWYTESKNPGFPNQVEHFRPKGKVTNKDGSVKHWYWFLAFKPKNYRMSCQFPNSLNKNLVLGDTGGKGTQFPLMPGSRHAAKFSDIKLEAPVLLDPCNANDTELLEFQPDGRPVLSMSYKQDKNARYRVAKSKLLLNLDYPTFNEDREMLYNKIKELVERGDRYHANGNEALEDVKTDLGRLMSADAEYSKAAECYIRCFRDREWIEALIL